MWKYFRKKSAHGQKPKVPSGTRVYAIGDIHGRHDLLNVLYRQIELDLEQFPTEAKTLLIHLGDYIDRGPDSNLVLDALSLPQSICDERILLLGNHEDLLMRFLIDSTVGRLWLQLGGDTTLASYQIPLTPPVAPTDRFETLRNMLIEKMPNSHRELLQTMPLFHQLGDYLFVHAGIRPGRAMADQVREDLLWIRDRFTDSRIKHRQIVVHGHHTTPDPVIRANRIGVDTGAYMTHRLTAAVLEAEQVRFISTGPNQVN